jgi:hypothetical protein
MTTPLADIDEDDALSAVDFEALTRAVKICQSDPATHLQIERKLTNEIWRDVAEFCAYSCQMDSLHLAPWQSPPAWVENLVGDIQAGDDGVLGAYQGAKLLRRLLDAGLSRYEPDPLAALKQAKKRSR